jgi:hypothetical protein
MLTKTPTLPPKIGGTYLMKEGREMVASFQFFDGRSFRFFFACGAVARSSSGEYTIQEDRIKLQANKTAGKDFTIVRREKRGAGTTIAITDTNPFLVRSILCIFYKDGEKDVQFSDCQGKAYSHLEDCDTIAVVHSLFPDVPTVICPDGPATTSQPGGANNYFELTLNTSLAEVSFQDISLSITDEGLVAILPYLFERKKVLFTKQVD